MKKRILSVILALCLCVSAQSVAYAGQGELLQQEDVFVEEAVSELEARDAEIPTPTEVYEAMIALKDQEKFKEGTPWTNFEPYSDSKGYYRWKGGTLGGTNIVAVGCVAFAFELSDAAFGELKARMYAPGEFEFEDIKPGDILRMNNDVHTVIVLEVNDTGVVVAEGNVSMGDHQGRVHWGRAILKEEVIETTSHYITRYPEGYNPPDDPEVDKVTDSGIFGGLSWSLTKAGTLTVSGSGAMQDFGSIEEQPWKKHNDQIRKVVIGDEVTNIGAHAFETCGVLSVKISPSVTTIGSGAFKGSSIISVNIPSNVKTIGDSAFSGCKSLSAVIVSEGVETIGQKAFQACTSLTSIVLPASIGEVGAGAFFQCQNMISATFTPGKKQVTLGDNVFSQCYWLMNVTLPKSADRIGAGMFQKCIMLPGVEIPQNVTSIGEQAFASCSALSTVIIPESVTDIEGAAFSDCSLLTDIYYTGTKEQWESNVWISPTTNDIIKNAKKHYEYTAIDISNAKVTLESAEYTYDGTDKTPTVTVDLNGKILALNADYTVSYGNNTNIGTATVTVTGKVGYTGSVTVNFEIVGDGNGGETENPGGSGGSGGGNSNPGGSDGSGGGNSNPGGSDGSGGGTGNPGGSGGSGNPDGSDGTDSADSSINLSKANITLDKNSYTYDGTTKTPAVTVTLDGKTLVLNTDYTVSYSNNIKVGTAAVTVTGKGKYTGSATINFTITEAAGQNPAVSITCKKTVYKVAYGVKPFKINAVSEGRMTFTSSKPKIAAVDKNTGEVTIKNTGVAVITVQAGNVSKQVTVKVSPKKQSVKSAKPGKGRKLTVKWAKDKKASGYQVQVSTDKKFKKNLKAKKTSKTSYTFTKLKTGKKYYVRVRSYKKSGKETLYGSWSKVKSTGKIRK